jgi:hypothetical protein
MNSPARVIGFVNAAHFIDHYSMLIFAAAVIVMGPALGMAYSSCCLTPPRALSPLARDRY